MRDLQLVRPPPIEDDTEQRRRGQELEDLRAERRHKVRAAALRAQMQQEKSQIELEISQQNSEKERIQ
jgi:hypothetical protein